MTADVIVVTQCAPYANGRMAGIHGSRGQAVSGFAEIAGARGWSTQRIEDVSQLNEQLGAARVLALYTIGEVPWSPAQRALILARLRAGEMAVVGVHSATDANHTWPEYGVAIGGRFAGHPVSTSLPITVADPSHPATSHLSNTWSLHDEFYLFADVQPDVHVLLHIDKQDADAVAPGVSAPAAGFPIAWCRNEGAGRVFYTALGHFPLAWEHPDYMQHVAGGFAWACGDA
jgi:type 1 glutamine amidotransferase